MLMSELFMSEKVKTFALFEEASVMSALVQISRVIAPFQLLGSEIWPPN
jgi:hypothetical protein